MSDAVVHGPRGLMDTGRLCQLAWFRTLSLVLQILSLPVAAVFLEASLPLRPVLAVLALNLGLLVGLWVRTRREQAGRDGEVFAHLLADQTALVALVSLTGGASNPLVMLLLLPLALAAVLLSLPRVLVLLALAVLGYFLLLSWPDTGAAGEAYRAHLRGMWIAFVLAALLLASFLYWTASALRYREAALRQLQLERLRDEKLLALAAQAAQAAHELGTPLSTARLLCDEARAGAGSTEQRQSLDELDTELQRVNTLLHSLAECAHQRSGDSVPVARLADWLQARVEAWRGLRPEIAPWVDTDPAAAANRFRLDEGVADALANLLSNAAAASPHSVSLMGRLEGTTLVLEVADRGPGYTPDVAAGAPRQGLGMGVMLASALAERAGGRLEYGARAGGGTCARIVLPRALEESA